MLILIWAVAGVVLLFFSFGCSGLLPELYEGVSKKILSLYIGGSCGDAATGFRQDAMPMQFSGYRQTPKHLQQHNL